jgi:thiamine kinase
MLSDELESVASRYIPGRGTLDIHRSSSGLVNETYRVLRDGRAYALRVAAGDSDDLGLDRAWEARVLGRAAAADLAPVLEYCDPQRGILIAHWVDGRSWSPTDVRRQANISRMAELLRRIHALPMPTPARVMGPANWIECYGTALRNVPAATPAELPETRGLHDSPRNVPAETLVRRPGARAARDHLPAAAARRLAALAALPSVDPVVCHSDLHTLNLVDRGDSLVLLDWEYAHAADPLWDLAGWSANNDLEDDLKQDLLASYAGRPPTSDEYLRLQLLGWLYDYVCLSWSELYLSRRGDESPDADMLGGIAARARLLAVRLDASK